MSEMKIASICFIVHYFFEKGDKTIFLYSSNNLSFFISFNFYFKQIFPFPAGRIGTLHDTFGPAIHNGKVVSLPLDFLVPSRDKHHDIYDLRCLVAGNIANGLQNSIAISLRRTFFRSANGRAHTVGGT